MTDLHDLAMKIRYDLTAAQSKLTELTKAIDALSPEVRIRVVDRCPECQVGNGHHTEDCPDQPRLVSLGKATTWSQPFDKPTWPGTKGSDASRARDPKPEESA